MDSAVQSPTLLERIILEDFAFEVYQDRPDFFFCQVHQVHGAQVVLRENSGEEIDADGIVSHNPNYPLAIKTADCLPIALIGPKGHGLVHAGWQGLKKKILFDPLLEQLKPQIIYIGPHIRKCCYAVDGNFSQHFEEGGYFTSKRDGQHYFDLTGLAIHQLKQQFPRATLYQSKICTHCNDRYNSYRRDKTDKRNYNILRRSSQ